MRDEIPVSAVEGVEWPAVPPDHSAPLLAFLDQLEATQWWPEATIRTHQMRQFARLLRHAVVRVPYYREKFREFEIARHGSIDADLLRALPILTKSDIRRAGARMLSERIPAGHGLIETRATSGSTGTPLEVQATALSLVPFWAARLRLIAWSGWPMSGKQVRIRAGVTRDVPPEGTVSADWGRPFNVMARNGPCVRLDIVGDARLLADRVILEQPDYLWVQTSGLVALLRQFRQRGERVASLRKVWTFAETHAPGLRQECRDVLGVEIYDTYGCIEAGTLALQCPLHETYHVQSEAVILEVLDQAGRPCRAGEMGRVVVTPLHNFAMPLIRYDTGDYAEAGDPCPCGRGLPVLRQVAGRSRDLLTLPSGEKRFAVYYLTMFEDIHVIQMSQIVQKSIEDFVVRIVADRPLTAAEEEFVRRRFREAIGPWTRVSFEYADHLPRAWGAKFESFKSELDA